MDENSYEVIIRRDFALSALNNLLEHHKFLTNEEKLMIVNTLIDFDNSHEIANSLTEKTARALYEELKVRFEPKSEQQKLEEELAYEKR